MIVEDNAGQQARKRVLSRERNARTENGRRFSARLGSSRESVSGLEVDVQSLRVQVRARQHAHTTRRRVYRRIDGSTRLFSLLFSTAAICAILAEFGRPFELGAIVTASALGLTNNVFRGGDRAREHDDAAQRYLELRREIVRAEHPGRDDLSAWRDRILAIQADSPPLNEVLLAVARNAVLRDMQSDAMAPTRVWWFQRVFAPLIALFPHKLRPQDDV